MANNQVEAVLRQSLDLSIADIQREHPSWSKVAVDDYFYKQSNINTLAIGSDEQGDQVEANTLAIAQNAQDIAENSGLISVNTGDIAQNSSDISDNTTDISSNTALINGHISDATDAHDASAISYDNTTSGLTADNAQAAIDEVNGKADSNDTGLTNHINNLVGAHAASAISYDNATSGYTAIEVQAAIDEGADDLDTHEALTTAHGVTGDNIGTEDYAQTLIGGAVLLAALVNDAADSAVSVDSPDATDLPSVITLANETKADVNQLVTDLNAAIAQLNDLIAKMKTAKQMSTV